MIKTTGLHFSYPSIQFSFPELYCDEGHILLVTGSSGKGKTTLLHILGGLLKPQSGMVNISGTDITKLKSSELDKFRGDNIGIVFQQPHFVASLNVIENLILANSLAGKKTSGDYAIQLMEQLGISQQAAKKPAQLSQGQLQRASIARAMMNQPALVLADEPTSSLDDENCEKVANLLAEQAVKHKAALIIVTHDQRLKKLFNQTIDLI